MFTHHSHPYLLQVAALWCSFLPAFAVVFLIGGAWLESLRRHGLLRKWASRAWSGTRPNVMRSDVMLSLSKHDG